MLLVAASMPGWLKWSFWVSPLSYGEIGISLNEFLSPRWQKVSLLLPDFLGFLIPGIRPF